MRQGSPAPCSRSGSSSSNASASSSRHRRLRAAVTGTSSQAPATICSRSARHSASGALGGSRSPRRTLIRSWRCGRCATRSAGTDSRTSASSSGSTSPAFDPRAVLAADRAPRDRDLQDVPRSRRRPVHHRGREAFVKWHAGQLTWAQATRDSRIQLNGPSWLVRAFPQLERSQHVRPHSPRPECCHRDIDDLIAEAFDLEIEELHPRREVDSEGFGQANSPRVRM